MVLLACVLTLLGLPTTAHAADTAATITKEIVGGPATYKVGETVTYRLTIQCSSLVGPCGIGTVTDVIDPNLQLSLADVVLPTTVPGGGTPPVMAKSLDGNTLKVTLGTAEQPFMDGPGGDILVTAKVKSYPIESNGEIPNGAKIDITNGAGDVAPPVVIKVEPLAKDWGLDKVVASGANPAPGELVTFRIDFTRPSATGGT